jgi:hypothetical protein
MTFGKLVEICCAGRLDVDPNFVGIELELADDHFAGHGVKLMILTGKDIFNVGI